MKSKKVLGKARRDFELIHFISDENNEEFEDIQMAKEAVNVGDKIRAVGNVFNYHGKPKMQVITLPIKNIKEITKNKILLTTNSSEYVLV